MSYISDFDVEDVLGSLKAISDKFGEGSRERDVIELAQIALVFPRHIRKEDEFRRYYKRIFDPSFKIKASRDFETREAADTWLVSGEAQDADRIRVAGRGFMVVRLPGRLTFMNAPLPGDAEDEEASGDD